MPSRLLKIAFACLILAAASPSTAQSVTPGEVLFKMIGAAKPAVFDVPGIDTVRPLLPAARTKRAAGFGSTYLARLVPGASVEAVVRDLAARPDVAYAQPNHVFRTFQATNDPRLSEQFHLDLIGWPALRAALPPKQKDVIVGIIDSGLDADHEDLAARVWVNQAEFDGRAGMDDDGNGYVDDTHGWDFTDAPTLPGQGDFTIPDNDPSDESSHGTQVAGVIGAIADNGIGVAGVADCRLMGIRAGLTFDQGGTFLQEDDLAAAILYAVDNGADILNLSWGSFDRAFVIEDAVRYATDRGVIVIAAAGNSAGPPVAYPAALDDVISVGAVETTGQLASFSSYGPVLDLVAPGVNIVSTRLDDEYGPRSGSSFAAPQVAGLAALLLSRQPDLTPAAVRGALVSATIDLGPAGWDASFGAGQADAAALVPYFDGTEPVAARIAIPATDDAVSGTVAVSAAVTGSATGYRLSWSPDTDPPAWTDIASGAAGPNISVDWTLPPTLTDSAVVLRLEAEVAAGARPVEHRVQLTANPNLPSISFVSLGPIVEADRVVWTARWITRRPSLGALVLSSDGGLTRDTIATGKRDGFHEAVIPDQTVARDYTFHIRAVGPDGAVSTTPEEPFTLVPARIPRIGFAETATLPDGFLADGTTDFDGNGRREIAVMPYTEGEPFSPVQIFEHDGTTLSLIHTTEQSVLPWNVGDVTHDGRPDLLGTSVARIQLLSGSPLPTSVLLDQSGVWGGSIADVDGDGALEIAARNLLDGTIRLYRMPAGGSFFEFASLVDFSPGSGEIGPRFVLADLDGNGRRDILAGDGDGDLWTYEFDGAFQVGRLREGPDDTDARVIGGGADLDGDGQVEIAVARATTDEASALNGWWDLEIYSVDAGGFVLEYAQRFSGVATPGNGISTGDLDGDGRPDLAVALIPDLYVIRADAPDTYRPIFHAPISLTYRPVIADLDGDDAAELIYNFDGAVRIAERTLSADLAQRPEILSVDVLAHDRVSLAWMPVSDASTYRVIRTTGGANASEILVVDSAALSFVDTGLTEGIAVTYRVDAVRPSDVIASTPVTVTPRRPPVVSGVDRIDDHRVAVLFDRPVGDSATDPNGWRLFPLAEAPTSVTRDHGSRRVVLRFASAILDGVTHRLEIRAAADLAGIRVDPDFRSVTFTPGASSEVARADFDADGVVGFSDFLLFAGAFGGTSAAFDLDANGTVGFSDFLIFAGLFGRSV